MNRFLIIIYCLFIIGFPSFSQAPSCGQLSLSFIDTSFAGFVRGQFQETFIDPEDQMDSISDLDLVLSSWNIEISTDSINWFLYRPPMYQRRIADPLVLPCNRAGGTWTFPFEIYSLFMSNPIQQIDSIYANQYLYIREIMPLVRAGDYPFESQGMLYSNILKVNLTIPSSEDKSALQWLQEHYNSGNRGLKTAINDLNFQLSTNENFSELCRGFLIEHPNSTLFPFVKVQVLYNDFRAALYQLEGHKSKQQLLSEIEALREYLPNPLLEPMIRDVEAGINIHLH